MLDAARLDILSVTRARELSIGENLTLNGSHEILHKEGIMTISLEK